ncbi:hypothetical protein OAU68_01660 [Litorivicinus sp.]|jgi:hypothetical protein|nr:hypothetical protein [Litorivicinus sp.]
MARETDQIAQDYSAMLGSVSVITNVIDDSNEFCNDMTTDEKKERVGRSMGYLVHMKALSDWGSESMTSVDGAITAATDFIAA